MARLAKLLALFQLAVSVLGQEAPEPLFNEVSTNKAHSKGTAAKVSPDGSKVFITADDGSLVIADASSGAISETKSNGVACNTGVTFSPDGTEVMYAVWLNAQGTESEIFAYSVADGSARWSHKVQGQLAGAPVYGRNGDYVYFTHNLDEGHFTVLQLVGGSPQVFYNASLTDLNVGPPKGVNMSDITSEKTWSGVAIAFEPERNEEIEDAAGVGTGEFRLVPGGNSRFGKDNTNDFVIWANLAVPGARTNTGYYYSFQLPSFATDPKEIIALDQAGWAVYRPFVLSSNGVRGAIAGQRGLCRGWTEPNLFSQGANIKGNIKQQQREGPDASYSTPSMTPDDKVMFFASTNNAVYGIKADEVTPEDDGSPGWVPWLWGKENLDSVVTAGTQPSADSESVFVATSNGMMHKLSVADGTDAWTNTKAPGEVEAEFSVLGNNMFFVTKTGGLSGWKVDDAVEAVTTTPPTAAPTVMPTETKVETEPPTEMQAETDAPTTSAPLVANATEEPTEMQDGTDMPTASPVMDNVTTEEPTKSPAPEPEETEEPTASPVEAEDTEEPTAMPTEAEEGVPESTAPPTMAETEEPTAAPSSAAVVSSGLALLIAALWSCVFAL